MRDPGRPPSPDLRIGYVITTSVTPAAKPTTTRFPMAVRFAETVARLMGSSGHSGDQCVASIAHDEIGFAMARSVVGRTSFLFSLKEVGQSSRTPQPRLGQQRFRLELLAGCLRLDDNKHLSVESRPHSA